MKKIVAIIVALSVMASSMVFAEEIDLSGKTVDELIEIQRRVDEALFEQGGKIVLDPGMYITGKDIAPGSYIVEAHNYDEKRNGTAYILQVWKDEQARSDYKSGDDHSNQAYYSHCLYECHSSNKESAKFTLEEGQVLEVSLFLQRGTSLTIEQAKGLFME